MARARSNPSHNVASLKRALAEKDALLAEKEALLIERDRVIAVRDAELYAKTLQIEHLKAQLAVLRRARFGRSSEKLDREIEQLELILGELEEGVAENSERAARAQPDAERGERAKRRDRKPLGRRLSAPMTSPLYSHCPEHRPAANWSPRCPRTQRRGSRMPTYKDIIVYIRKSDGFAAQTCWRRRYRARRDRTSRRDQRRGRRRWCRCIS
jgi:hypothetical protein